MSEVHERVTVLCPYDQTPQAALAYLNSLPLENGKRVMAIRIETDEGIIERRGDISLTPRQPALDAVNVINVIMDIQWGPHGGGPFPCLTGTLTVEESDGNFCRIALDASYESSTGFAAQLFEVVAGNRIAHAAFRQLLDGIKTGFELAFQTGMSIA